MKTTLTALGLSLAVAGAQALPQLGYYKARYSADTNYECVRVTSNTKQVTLAGKKVTYFEFTQAGEPKRVCIPQVYYDADDTPVDGDPAHVLFISTTIAMCTAVDGSGHAEVAFSSNRLFWGGDVLEPVTVADIGLTAFVKVKEKQTVSAEFYSASSCPP